MASTMSLSERLSYGIDAFGSIGIGREAALGAMGGLAGESGFGLNTAAFNASDPNGGSKGIGQWHSDRRVAMEAMSKDPKYAKQDPYKAQMDYVVHELKTTHKSVADKLRDPNISRAKATKTWTREYEIPKKEYEFLDKRIGYADKYAKMLDKVAPVNPAQAAIDAAPKKTVADAVQDIGKVGLTGAAVAGTPSAAAAYTDPEVSARGVPASETPAARAIAAATSTPGSPAMGTVSGKAAAAPNTFGGFLGGIAEAVGGVYNGVSGFTNGLANLDPHAAFSSVSGKPADPAQQAAAANDKAAAKTQGGIEGFLGGDASVAAAIGTMAGGFFGGPMGAIAGGLVGQGIDKALNSISAAKEDDVTKEADAGITGGVGRALGGLFGGVGSIFGGNAKAATPSYGRDFFPDAPSAPSGGFDSSQFSGKQMSDAKDWSDSHSKEMNSAGLY